MGKIGLKGKHEWLKLYCAFGLDAKSNAAVNVIKDNNYFNYESATSYLDSIHLRNESMTSTKITLISYLFECCYDILLSKQHNISESPGYEKIVKQFGRRQD